MHPRTTSLRVLVALLLAASPAHARSAPDSATETRTIYVPYDKLDAALNGIGKGVVLPFDEFQRLLGTSLPYSPVERSAAPPPFVVSDAQYAADVRGDWASLRVAIRVESFRDGWQLVPLGLAGLAAASSDAAGEARWVATDAGWSLLVPGRGSHVAEAEFALPIGADRGARTLGFATAKAAFSRLSVTVPEAGVAFEPAGAVVASVRDDAESTTLLAFLGSADSASVRFTLRPREEQGTPEIAAETRADLSIDETTVRLRASASVRVGGGAVERLALAIPSGFVVLAVDGPDVRSWRASAGRIEIDLRRRVRGTSSLDVDLEASRDPAQSVFAFSLPSFEGASRESGWLAVSAAPTLRARLEPNSALRRVDPGEIGADPKRRPGLEAHRYVRPPGELRVTIEPVRPRIVAATDHRYHLGDSRLTLDVVLALRVEDGGTFRVRVVAPAGLDRDPLVGADLVESVRTTRDGDRDVLEISLRKRAEGALRLPLEFAGPFDLGAARALPRFELLDAERDDGHVGISMDPALRATVVSSAGLDAVAASSLPPEAFPPAPSPVALAFRHGSAPFSIELRIERREVRTTAVVDGSVRVEENRLLISAWLRHRIEFAGRSSFRFAVPTAALGRLKVDAPNVKSQVIEGEDPSAPGESIVRIELQSEVRDQLVVHVAFEMPADALAIGASGDRRVAPLRVLDAERQSGSVALQKSANLEVAAQAEGGEQMDPSELPEETRTGAFLAFRFVDLGRSAGTPPSVSLHVTRREYQPLLEAWVQHLDLLTVVGGEGTSRTAAAIAVKNAGLQFLEIALPKGSSILTLAVAGESKRPARRTESPGDATILVPLPRSADPDRPFLVQLVWETKHDGASISEAAFGGSLDLLAPRIEGVPVSLLSWTVCLPRTSRYLSFGGNLEAHRGDRWFEFPEFPREVAGVDAGAPAAAASDGAGKGGAYAISIALDRDGVEHRFSRLGGDGRLVVRHVRLWVFRSLEAIAFVLPIGAGLALGRRRPRARGTLLLVGGAALLVLVPLVDDGLLAIVDAAILGVIVLAGGWLVVAAVRSLIAFRSSPPIAPAAGGSAEEVRP
jgi:hypothetical protein